MQTINFTKMQGAGNDYIYVNCMEGRPSDLNHLAKTISDRHYGVGSDGLVLICPSDKADFRMEMYNSDGTQAEMCGNASRCIGKYVHDRGLTDKTTVTLETLAGIKILKLNTGYDGKVESVCVNMGNPILTPADIPVKSELDKFVMQNIEVGGKNYQVTCVSMGNPHAITYVDDVNAVEIEKIGPLFENHAMFPQRTNTEFVQIVSRSEIRMRVWERGAGETLACGTGACATLVAAVLSDLSEREADIVLLGGTLHVKWDKEDNNVYMSGPAEFVFDGTATI